MVVRMALTKDEQKLLARDGADKQTLALITTNEQLRKARHDLTEAERAFELRLDEQNSALVEMQTRGTLRLAGATGAGIVLGGGGAYFGHDFVAEEFGKATIPALVLIPAIGAAALFFTWKKSKTKKRAVTQSEVEGRMLGYGFGFGALLVGGYLSYEDYIAANPS